jgi:general nucleoside transport system permease protein
MNKLKTSTLFDLLTPPIPPDLRGMIISGLRPFFAIFLALIVSAVLILLYGKNPITAFGALLDGAIGSIPSLANTGVRATPLLFGGLAVAFAFKAGMLNVGVEGQIYAGGAAATTIGLIPLPIPPIFHLALAIIAGFIGGLLWGLIPALLRAFQGRSEIVTTLMFNFLGIYFVSYLVQFPGPLAQEGATFPMSPPILSNAHFPILIRGTSLHAGILLATILILIFFFILKYTPFGYRVRMIGQNPEAARYAGVKVTRLLFFVLLLSAGIGGLAGTGEVLGLRLRLFDFFSGGLGYDAIGVALLANANPLGVVLTALFFGALRSGASRMQIVVGIETPIAEVIQALAVLFVIAIGFGQRIYYSRKDTEATDKDNEDIDAHGN